MLRDATYKDKFQLLESWMPSILETIKKEVRRDHLKKNYGNLKEAFPGRPVSKLTPEELAPVYWKWVVDGDEELGEWLANCWILKHTDVYDLFAADLSKVASDFDEIEELELELSQSLIGKSSDAFGAEITYLFSVLNSVVFPKSEYDKLAKQAEEEVKQAEVDAQQELENASVDKLKSRYEAEIRRMESRYEKKLEGMQRKYESDTATLKKQIANLQRKLDSAKVSS